MHKLFTAGPIDSIIDIFNSIDFKIIALINCSSEDFLNLNSNFKRYHSQIKQISDNTDDILSLFGNEGTKAFIQEITEITNNYKQCLDKYNDFLSNSQKAIEDIGKNLEYLFIPVSNYNQDLKTLKFLSTNLKLDPETVKISNKFIEIIDSISSTFPHIATGLRELKYNIEKAYSTLNTLKENYFNRITKNLNYFSNLIQYTLEKYQESQKMKPLLIEKMKLHEKCSSEIITNLQYQDIVKQKIEHVQQSHNEIVNKLDELIKNKDHPDYLLNKAKIFIQIHNISGLQTAQLVHANLKYQKALEIITSKILELSQILEDISEMCNSYCSHYHDNEAFTFYNNEFDFRNLALINDDFDTSLRIYKLNINSISEKIIQFSKNHANLKIISKSFKEIVNKDIEEIKIKDRKKTFELLNQINEVFENYLNTINYLEVTMVKINKTLDYIISSEGDKIIKDIKKIFKINTEKLQHSIKGFNNYKRDLINQFSSNNKFYEVSEDIKRSIEKVKYYELFEKEIDEIISSLNTISKELQIDDESLDSSDKEIIERIKKKYTMKSERTIHDELMDKNRMKINNKDFKEYTGNIEEEENNVEFF